MSKANDITYLKSEAVKHWQRQPISERLSMADWDTYGKNLGVIYHGIVRIWITPDGKLSTNKPKGIKA